MNRYALFCLSLLFCIAEASADTPLYFVTTSNTSNAPTNIDTQLNLASLNITITDEAAELRDSERLSRPAKLIAVALSLT